MHNQFDVMIRNDTCKHIREVRRILRGNMAEIENNAPKTRHYWIGGALVVILSVLVAICLFCGCAMGQNLPISDKYTNIQYVNAIYKAEGGIHARYAYGIRSVHYRGIKEAREICLRTIKHKRRGWQREVKLHGFTHYSSFTQYLASKYCPTKSRNLTASEARLNKYWIKNVEYYLHKQTKGA